MGVFMAEKLYWLADKIFFWQSEVDPKPGDLIEISRKGYQHWTVYVGSGYIVHLAQPDVDSCSRTMSIFSSRAVVKKELLSVVAGTNRYRVNNKHDSEWTVRSPEEIVSKAEKLVGQTVNYKLFLNNCEHFAKSLRYDVAWSDQVWYLNLLGVVVALAVLQRSSKENLHLAQ